MSAHNKHIEHLTTKRTTTCATNLMPQTQVPESTMEWITRLAKDRKATVQETIRAILDAYKEVHP